LITLIQQNKDIKEEIKKRQINMLKEIGITTPSTRVMMIVEQTGGNNFPAFDTMIKYVKTAKKYKKRKRPKRRVIYAPKELIETFKKI
jgi:antitoxin component of RelBE/YafQ-DinJ toxin-antitoxin module